MAKKSGLGQQIFVNGYDLSGDVASIDNAGSPRELLDTTALNASHLKQLYKGQQPKDSFLEDLLYLHQSSLRHVLPKN